MRAKHISLSVVPMLIWASVALADPIVITSGGGGFAPRGELSGVELFGSGTRLIGSGRGGFSPFALTPGEVVTFRSNFGIAPTPFQPHSQIVAGVAYGSVFLRGGLSFVGDPFIVPPIVPGTPDGQFFTTPMVMTGQLLGFSTFDGEGPPLFSIDVTGTGRMSFGPFRYSGFIGQGGPIWVGLPTHAGGGFSFVQSAPAPVPEPATLILLATGVVGTALRTRRRGR